MKKKIQKPFDVEAAKNGAMVETREGNSVRILCYDMNDSYPIVALTSYGDCEAVRTYQLNGKYNSLPDYSEDLVIIEEIEAPERWADEKDAIGDGWYIDSVGDVHKGEQKFLNDFSGRKFFATEKQAKSALAMARISQLMAHDERYGGVVTDEEWNDDTEKFCIRNLEGIDTFVLTAEHYYLAFHTAEQRDLFLAENEQLVKDYLMID